MELKFEMLKEQSSIIKVIGVGGGGGNAVNHMYKQGISGVDFIICNTDAQALELSPIPNKVQLGTSLTEGMGAGSDPDVGENSAIESIDEIKAMLGGNTKMLFITAGMGGGTGTGASPVLAKAAKELGILTVAIVTTPFAFEGKRRKSQAEDGLSELQKYVDSYLVISNDRLREIFGNLTMAAAFAQADDILTTAAKGIAEIITIPGYVNVDFKDVRTVMCDSGVAIMGNAKAEGEDRAKKAVVGALASPLLKDSEIEGARYILLNITSGTSEVTMDEVSIITDYIQDKAGMTADLIWGNCTDETLGEQLSVTIIATGFQTMEERIQEKSNERIAIPLESVEESQPARSVNQFIQREDAHIKTEEKKAVDEQAVVQDTRPIVKPEPGPTDLFSSYGKPQTKEQTIIKHNLIEDSAEEDTEESALDEELPEFQVKTSDTEFHFEIGAVNDQIEEADSVVEKDDSSDIDAPIETAHAPVEATAADPSADDASIEEQLQKAKERIMRLRDLGIKLRSASGLQEIENEPAYKRKQMALENTPHSSESQVSRFTLSKDEDQTDIRPNNSFLHDNVD